MASCCADPSASERRFCMAAFDSYAVERISICSWIRHYLLPDLRADPELVRVFLMSFGCSWRAPHSGTSPLCHGLLRKFWRNVDILWYICEIIHGARTPWVCAGVGCNQTKSWCNGRGSSMPSHYPRFFFSDHFWSHCCAMVNIDVNSSHPETLPGQVANVDNVARSREGFAQHPDWRLGKEGSIGASQDCMDSLDADASQMLPIVGV